MTNNPPDPVLSERVARLAVDIEGLSVEVRGLRDDLQEVARSLARLEGHRDAGGLAPETQQRPGDVLAGWVAIWSPWHVVAVVALLVGGPTVAGPLAEHAIKLSSPATLAPALAQTPAKPKAKAKAPAVDTAAAHGGAMGESFNP